MLKLKELRFENKATQQDIADKTNISRSIISQYENGVVEPTASVIVKLADFFNVSADELLGRTDDFGSVITAPVAPALSAEEQQLINDYRKLTPPLKRMVQETMKTFTDSELNSQFAKKNA